MGADMRLLTLILMSVMCSSSLAVETKKTIQVSATIAPYCVIVSGADGVKQVCRGYENKNVVPVSIKTEGNTTTMYY